MGDRESLRWERYCQQHVGTVASPLCGMDEESCDLEHFGDYIVSLGRGACNETG